MTDQPTYPRIILPEGIGQGILHIQSNEWFVAEVELENGSRYTLNFLRHCG